MGSISFDWGDSGHEPENENWWRFLGIGEIRLQCLPKVINMVSNKKFFLLQSDNSGKRYPGKETFQGMALYNTHKSTLRNVFLFVYHRHGIWNRNKYTDWFWLDKSSK